MNYSNWNLKSKSKYTIWLFNQFENIRYLFRPEGSSACHGAMSCQVQPPHHQKPTKYLNLHMSISQIYTSEQQFKSTFYPHYLHLPCDVKLKSYSIFRFKKIINIFYDFLLKKKTFEKEKYLSIN